MPRISEAFAWDEERAKKPGAMWGCWDCGAEESYVRDVDKDTDHVRVRRRQCTRCGSMWETEERRIARGSFFGRAEGRRYASFRKKRYSARTCVMCHEKYMNGKFREHTEESPAHKRVVARRRAKSKDRERRYQRRWMAAKREVEKASRSKRFTCKRCGGVYLEGTYRTKHCKTKRHRAVLREERNAKRRVRRQEEQDAA